MPNRTCTPKIPPLDRPTGWRPADEIVPVSEEAAVEGRYDWLVVGAGITGLSAAHRLGELAPQDRVLLVDARPVGWGASGRNSGFLLDLPHKFDLDHPDAARLHKIMKLNRSAISVLQEQTERLNIACDWSPEGKLQGAVKKRGTGMMRKFCDALDKIGEHYEVLDRQACAAIMGTDYYAGAVFTPGTVLVDPFLLVRGLALALPENVTLRDDAAVVEFREKGDGFDAQLRLSGGETCPVSANRVILATDPYTAEFGYMKNRILPTITYASITRALTLAERKRYSGRMNWGLTPADAGGTTLRMTADGRLLIRNHYGYAPDYRASGRDLAKVAEAHREGLDRRFPALSDVPITSTWGGVVSLSRNHATFFGEMAPGVYSANCYNGVGMTRGASSGRLLVDLAVGHKSQELEDVIAVSGRPSVLPPDPFRSVGVNGRMKLVEWESRSEI
ncbi:FAD-binding oxidoreductase [Leisingera sp. S132]|uniref:NAD(P)/FAD-dependent oxidoreductase n=1 Tax=Leisingera sp. S132 TaxID=2867016 RepID=UPI0021A3C940|nr:FAD-dependent oxidoreductase [Leisingera sp. S132]UWQ79713.1 FAD-binding oxidoreductase [Leisingera sp. S132]